jgi:hypothetical protein
MQFRAVDAPVEDVQLMTQRQDLDSHLETRSETESQKIAAWTMRVEALGGPLTSASG